MDDKISKEYIHKIWRDKTINRNLSKIVNLYSGTNKVKDSNPSINFKNNLGKKAKSFAKLRRKTMAFLPHDFEFDMTMDNTIEE